MFHDLKTLLRQSLRQKRIGEAVEAAQVVEAFCAVVAEMFGDSAAKGLRQVMFKGDTLHIAAGSGVLASEMRMRQIEISRQLSERLSGQSYRLKIFG